MIKLNNKTYTCPIDLTLSFVGGKWKLLILSHLYNYESRSYSEIRDNLPGVSEKMLSQQLKELDHDQFIKKDILSKKPLRVMYSLTEQGKSLSDLYELTSNWGIAYLKRHGIDYLKDQHLYK
ncbi:MAG: transcriptional regulator [Pedobacter sp.]|nr:MAG: transcriptional regulator [Pedobacter sp.]